MNIEVIIEDFRKKLLFQDHTIRCRSVSKLLDLILQKKPKNAQISSSTPQIRELSLLWEVCGNNSFSSSVSAMEGICSLVIHGHMQFDHACNKFLSIVTSNGNAVAPIAGITRLLKHQFEKDLTIYGENVPYLDYSKHPLVNILESKTETFQLVLENVIEIISEDKSLTGLRTVQHLLNYIFLSPQNAAENVMSKVKLLNKILFMTKEHPVPVLNYLLQILPWIKITNVEEASYASYFLSSINEHVADLLIRNKGQNMKAFENYDILIFVSLVFSDHCLKYRFNCSSLLASAEDICLNLIPDASIAEACLILLAACLHTASELIIPKLISLGSILLQHHRPTKFVVSILIIQTVHLHAEPKAVFFNNEARAKQILLPFLKKLQDYANLETICADGQLDKFSLFVAFSSSSGQAVNWVKFIHHLNSLSENELTKWLHSLKEPLKACDKFSDFHFFTVSGLLLLPYKSQKYIHTCLEVLEIMCDKQQIWATKMFTLLMYRQSLECNPEIKLLLMEYLPRTASHQYSVTPVLNILLMMGKRPELLPQAISFLLLLWKKHNRCFPQLHKLIAEKVQTVSDETGICEVLVTQAAAVTYLCNEVPHMYSEQLLGDLSGIISIANSDESTPAAVVALNGVYSLCKSEAIDLLSVWKALAPKLIKDKRPEIAICMCNFLGLVPKLQVNSLQYEKFVKESALLLWRIVSSESVFLPSVVSAAYEALANFENDSYLLKELPNTAKVNLTIPSSMVCAPSDKTKNPENVLTYIPGYCFVDLLESIKDPTILKGYEPFIQSLVFQEVKSMPQVVYTSVRRTGRKSNPNKLLSSVPKSLSSKFESKSLISCQKNLAVGILLSYEPSLELNKEGHPTKRSLISQAQSFKAILNSLLGEVNLDYIEWQRCLIIPSAWSSFMERAFFACEESYRTEVKSQTKNKLNENILSNDEDISWLWARDQLFEVIGSTANNTSNSMANSLFAVSGLVHAIEKYYGSLDSKSRDAAASSNYLAHKTFQKRCLEFILQVLDPAFGPYVFKQISWMITFLSKQSTSGSALIRGSAAASICHLIPIIISFIPDDVPKLLDIMHMLAQNDSSPLSLYSGIGLGMFVQTLCEKGYITSMDSQEKDNIKIFYRTTNISENLINCCKDENPKCGSLIALTLILTSLSKIENGSLMQWIKDTSVLFHEKLLEGDPNSSEYEVLSVCTCCMMVNATLANLIPIKTIEDLLMWFGRRLNEVPQCSSTSVCLGILLDALVCLGQTKAMEISKQMQKLWYGTIASQEKPTLHRVASLNGLCALFSNGRGLVQINQDKQTSDRNAELNNLIQLLLLFLSHGNNNPSLQSISCWELGRMAFLHSQQSEMTMYPTNYSYLGDRSVLKPLCKFIEDAMIEENSTVNSHLLLSVKALCQKFPKPLPPINWIIFLTPLLQKSNDSDLVESSLKILMYQMTSSENAKSMFSSFVTPPVIHTIPECCILMLLGNIAEISISLPTEKLQAFLKVVGALFGNDEKPYATRRNMALKGILEFYKLPNYSKEAAIVIQNVILTILQNKELNSEHLQLLCDIVVLMSKESQEIIFQELENGNNLCTLVYLLCQLVKVGKLSLSMLKIGIEIGQKATESDQEIIIVTLLDCFINGMPKSQESPITILMEMIGQMKLLLNSKANSTEVVRFLFDVCMTVIIGAAGYAVSYTLWPKEVVNHKTLIQHLSVALVALVEEKEWTETLNKILDWLFELQNSSQICAEDRTSIETALCALRGSKSFNKFSFWTNVIHIDNLNLHF